MSNSNGALAAALGELPSLRRVLIVVWFGFALSVTTTIARKTDSTLGGGCYGSLAWTICSLWWRCRDPAMPALVRAMLRRPIKLQWILSLIYPSGISPRLPKFLSPWLFLYSTSARCGILKISILAFYRRFFPCKPYHLYLYVCAAGMAMLAIAVTLATVFQCDPVSHAWDPGSGRCTRTNGTALGVAFNVLNLATDLFLLLLPIPVVVRIRADIRKKVALIVLFSLGAIGTAVTALRLWKLVVLQTIYGRELATVRWHVEVTYAVLLSHTEFSIIATCANLPALFAWCRRKRQRSHGSTSWPQPPPSPSPQQQQQQSPLSPASLGQRSSGAANAEAAGCGKSRATSGGRGGASTNCVRAGNDAAAGGRDASVSDAGRETEPSTYILPAVSFGGSLAVGKYSRNDADLESGGVAAAFVPASPAPPSRPPPAPPQPALRTARNNSVGVIRTSITVEVWHNS